jgi:quinol monooxygenase YgiN
MIVVRFKAQFRPEKTEEALAAFESVIAPSRALEGVISYDGGRDLADPHAIIFTEVFEGRAALDRQEALPEVQRVMGLFGELLVGEPEATIYHVSSSEPYGG